MEQIEFEPLVSQPATSASPPRYRLGGLAVGVAVAATMAMGLTVAARSERSGPPLQEPVAHAASVISEPAADLDLGTATRPTRFEVAYGSCMSGVAGPPDARERWVESCRREAHEILHRERIYAACMSDAGGSADSLERHAAACDTELDSAPPCRVSCNHSYFRTIDRRSSSRNAS